MPGKRAVRTVAVTACLLTGTALLGVPGAGAAPQDETRPGAGPQMWGWAFPSLPLPQVELEGLRPVPIPRVRPRGQRPVPIPRLEGEVAPRLESEVTPRLEGQVPGPLGGERSPVPGPLLSPGGSVRPGLP